MRWKSAGELTAIYSNDLDETGAVPEMAFLMSTSRAKNQKEAKAQGFSVEAKKICFVSARLTPVLFSAPSTQWQRQPGESL